ncbi:MAG: helix-turn-helix domain-containing protein, partial [Ktedonobacterales bacterium]
MANETGADGGFGEVLRRQRRSAGLTQEELAARAGLSARGIADLERGVRHTPRRDTVSLLVGALGGSPADAAALFAAARRPPAPTEQAAHPSANSADQHTTPHNLPFQPTPLLGREEQLSALAALLRRHDVRLVTVTGPGGIGKTRLAIEVTAELLEDYPDGAWFVRLSRLTEPGLVLSTIAQTLGLKESDNLSIAETLQAHVAAKRLLLVLDNFEQVVGAASEMAALLETSPHLRLLVTSRLPLHVRAEREYPLAPLSLPDTHALPPVGELAQYAAVALFLERAQATKPGFELTEANA